MSRIDYSVQSIAPIKEWTSQKEESFLGNLTIDIGFSGQPILRQERESCPILNYLISGFSNVQSFRGAILFFIPVYLKFHCVNISFTTSTTGILGGQDWTKTTAIVSNVCRPGDITWNHSVYKHTGWCCCNFLNDLCKTKRFSLSGKTKCTDMTDADICVKIKICIIFCY